MALKHQRQLNIRIGDDEYTRLCEMSEKMGLSVSETVRLMIYDISKYGTGSSPGQPTKVLGSGQE